MGRSEEMKEEEIENKRRDKYHFDKQTIVSGKSLNTAINQERKQIYLIL